MEKWRRESRGLRVKGESGGGKEKRYAPLKSAITAALAVLVCMWF
jgi:hypothetical protein